MWYLILFLCGLIGCTIAEYKLGVNFADVILNFFRSAEKKALILEQRAKDAATAARQAIKDFTRKF